MTLLVIFFVWIFILLVLFLYLGFTPKGKALLYLIIHYGKVNRFSLFLLVVFVSIFLIFLFYPQKKSESLDYRKIYVDFSRQVIEELAANNFVFIDSSCHLKNPKPELAYYLPTLLKAYHQEVSKGAIPRLIFLEDTLRISFDGFKQFKNRGIRITKKIRKVLGPRYLVNIESKGESHILEIYYKGELWEREKLCALPVVKASLKEGINPAVMMSLIRHISNFRFEYKSPRGGHGLLGLDSLEYLEQINFGAKILADYLKKEENLEDVVIALFPLNSGGNPYEEWRNNNSKRMWVQEVIKDIDYYYENGIVEGFF